MLEESTIFFGHVIMAMPARQLRSFLSDEEIRAMELAYQEGGARAVISLLTPEIIKRYNIAGTIEECIETVRIVAREYQLDVFLLNLTGGELAKNVELMRETREILTKAGSV